MIILGTNSIKDTGYNVGNSLRFNKASSDYLNRSNSSSTGKIWTFSCWIKISDADNGNMNIFNVSSDANNTTYVEVATKSGSGLEIQIRNGTSGDNGTYLKRTSNAVLRDISAFYNVIIIFDSTNGTADDRLKIFLNGERITSFASTAGVVPENCVTQIGVNNAAVEIGRNTSGAHYLDGYLAEVVLVDGTAQATTDFGEFDEDSNIWKPIDVSGLTFGTNGFYLDFEDSSALGNDAAGSNNFTVNNLTALDQSTDTCTNNYATGNPLDNGCGKAPTFSEGNLKYVSSSTFNFALPTIGVSSGKWYMEIKYVAVGSGGSIMAGITDQFDNTNRDLTGNAFAGGEPLGIGYYQNGNKYLNNVASSYGSTYTTGDIIGVYLDVDNSKLYFAKNGTLQNSGTGLDLPSSANSTGVFFFMPSVDKATIEVNYGNPTFTGTDKADANGYGSFKYSPSAGTFDGASKDFYALNTKNLSEYG